MAQQRRRILYCMPSLKVGGGPRRCAMLANEAARRGHTVGLLVQFDAEPKVAELDPAVDYLCLHHDRSFLKGGGVPKLRQAIADWAPDVYHGFGNVGCYYGAPLARRLRVPAVVTSTMSIAGGDLEAKLETWLARWALRYPHRITVNSRRALESYRDGWQVPERRLIRIPNFVDAAAFAPRPASVRAALRAELGLDDASFVAGTVGRLSPPKGHDLLLRAAAILAPQRPSLQVVIAGGGPLDAELRQLARSVGVLDRVHYLGDRRDVADLLSAFDLFVLPSVHEGMPNALLEAMAAGLPAVGTAVSGTEELIVEGATGWLTTPGDATAFATAMGEAMGLSLALLADMGRAARRRIEAEYTLGAVTERFFRLYEELLGEAGVARAAAEP